MTGGEPVDWYDTAARRLDDALARGDLESALEACATCEEQREQALAAAPSQAERFRVLGRSRDLGSDSAFLLVHSGRPLEAVYALERSLQRVLGDEQLIKDVLPRAVTSHNPDQTSDVDEAVDGLIAAYRRERDFHATDEAEGTEEPPESLAAYMLVNRSCEAAGIHLAQWLADMREQIVLATAERRKLIMYVAVARLGLVAILLDGRSGDLEAHALLDPGIHGSLFDRPVGSVVGPDMNMVFSVESDVIATVNRLAHDRQFGSDWRGVLDQLEPSVAPLAGAVAAAIDSLLKAAPPTEDVSLVLCGAVSNLPVTSAPVGTDDDRTLLDVCAVRHLPSAVQAHLTDLTSVEPNQLSAVRVVHDPSLDPCEVQSAEEFASSVNWLFDAADGGFFADRSTTEPGVLHLVCHGEYRYWQVLNAAFYLGGETLIDLRELLSGSADLRGHHVIAAACQSGHGWMTETRDESTSLAHGLLYAGASGVLASAWPLDDTATAVLVATFYEHWRSDIANPWRALTRAQRLLRTLSWDGFCEYARGVPALEDLRIRRPQMESLWYAAPEQSNADLRLPWWMWGGLTYRG